MTGPFRETPRMLSCPRCGEILDRGLDRIRCCLRCEGVWLPHTTLDAAFGDARWPGGQAQWWRNAIECPDCATEGVKQLLEARVAKGVLFDRCHTHGIWLDRSELGRLMETTGDEVVELQRRLSLPQEEIDALAQRRAKWRDDLAARRQATADYDRWLEELRRQREEAAANALRAQQRREAEARIAAEETTRRITERERARQTIGNRLAAASEDHAKQEQQVTRHRDVVKQLETHRVEHRALGDKLEAELALHRDQLTAMTTELQAATGRVRALHDELAALAAQPV
ncbi:MAG: zf-TFIIB domain-containing protein [Kofleriaceae bacterium]